MMKPIIRPETIADFESIRQVNDLAFRQNGEGKLVGKLRDGGFATLSMVAEIDGTIVGHVLFSRLQIAGERETIDALALAPMAVMPPYQRQSIGSQMIQAALDQCRVDGHRIVIVLGHPDYYRRFGFSTELAKPLQSIYAGDSFMALELVSGAMRGVAGTVEYAAPFSEADDQASDRVT